MKDQLLILDEHLRKTRADFYSNLRSPLSENEIADLEKKYNVKIPVDLVTLYSWKDGQDYECTTAFVNNSMFMPLETVLYTAYELNGMIGSDFETKNWWNQDWFPIFHNGGGDYICYDSSGTFTGQKGQLIEFWHADGDRNVIAPNLETFLAKINEYYYSTPVKDFDEYFEIEDMEGFPKTFIVNETTGNKNPPEPGGKWWKKLFGSK